MDTAQSVAESAQGVKGARARETALNLHGTIHAGGSAC